MQRLLEIILGLDRGFLNKEGDFSIQFNPRWPLQEYVGATTWNLLLGLAALALVIYVYRREGRSRATRVSLGIVRALLLAFVLAMLNRPSLTLTQSRTDPSILAILIDDSISMSVRDGGSGPDGSASTRLQAVLDLLTGDNQKLVRDLARKHILKFYRFDSDPKPLATVTAQSFDTAAAPTTLPSALAEGVTQLRPEGRSTQILASLRGVLEELQGQRLAGVVLLTDGRNTPVESLPDNLPLIENFRVRIYPVAVGSEKAPRNLAIEHIDVQDSAFAQDIVSATVHVRGTGLPPGHTATLVLKNKKTNQPLLRADGKPAQTTVTFANDAAQDVEINFKPTEIGTLNLVAELVKQPGEVDEEDNTLPAQIAVLDSKIAVLYCDGYPRWDYRYLKNEMIRDETVDISCLLLSADAGFAQEGDKPITRFPESMTELLAYDVILFGDVDPRQFTDAQIQLISEFVARKNGGFGMVAGPRWSPYAYRNTPIEALLPVTISRAQPESATNLPFGWRIALTKDGAASTIFRFFEDRAQNEKFLRDEIQPLFWYAKGLTVKPGVGEVYAEHPSDLGPDGRKSPILVLGRFGGGRTLFSAIDDSWRWRFYTGESVFDTYWVQQIRYLARAKKLGQRRFTVASLRPAYQLGQQIEVNLRVLDPDLLQQLPDNIGVVITQKTDDGADQAVRQESLQRRESERDLFVASWTADRVGRFTMKLPALGPNTPATELPIIVSVPRLELFQPAVDRDLLAKLAASQSDTTEQPGPDLAKLQLSADAPPSALRDELRKIPSAAMIVPVYTSELLWNAPLAMALFLLLICVEWVLRKMYGLL